MRKVGVIIGSIIGIILLTVAAIGGYQYHTKTGFFRPGEVIFAGDVPADARELITKTIADNNIQLHSDLTIELSEKTSRTDGLLYNIYVPVTDFYDSASSVSAEVARTKLIPFAELNNKVKLLAIDDQYFLDDLQQGAFFDYFELQGNSADVVKITTLLAENLPHFPTADEVLTFAQTGVTALSRGMNVKLKQVDDATYFAANIGEFLRKFDLTHTSNESSFSNLAGDRDICSQPKMMDALTAIGLDIVELTGNHNQDCGDQAALDTLARYAELGIQPVGGGATAELAAVPLQINQKGNNLTLLGYNLSTGGYTLDGTPGANFYTPEKAQADIAAAKARGDVVIVDLQYYECNAYASETEDTTCDYANSAAGDQIGLFRELINMGADVVVGTSAHQPQTYELYGDGVIYYGLGNLFFDQIWWSGTTRSLILVHYFWNNQLLQTRIVPTIYGDSMQPELMGDEPAAAFIERLNSARPRQ